MSHRRRAGRALAGIGLLAVAAVAAAGPAGAATHKITQFTMKSPGNQPGDMTIGNDGNVWFVDHATNKIGRITRTGGIAGFAAKKGSHPTSITTGSDGAVWFTETATNTIGRTTTGSNMTHFALPAAIKSARGITAGPDGRIYVAGYSSHNIGVFDPTTHKWHIFATLAAGSGPVRMTTGADGNLYVTESKKHAVAEITVPGKVVSVIGLPVGAAASRIVSGPDGNLWVTEPGLNKVAIVTPGGGTPHQISVSGKPTGIAAGPETLPKAEFMWVTLQSGTGGNAIGRIPVVAPRTVKKYALPTPKSLPSGITVGADGNIWFSEAGKNRIGKLADAPGHTSFVAVNDHGFVPATQGIPVASNNGTPVNVEWLFRGAKHHSVTDSTTMNLFNSGSIAPGKNFVTTFATAGSFAYKSTVGTDTMHGTIKVAPLTASGSGTDIDVTVGTTPIPAGVTTDIQVEVPGATTFSSIATNFGGTTFTYTPTGSTGSGQVYKFQVRTNSNGDHSDWSPTARFTF
jgi:virginiamycin B lyase